VLGTSRVDVRSTFVRRAALALATLVVALFALAARADAFIYWANGPQGSDSIARANLDGTGVDQTFIPGLSGADGVAVDTAHVYWGNSLINDIGRANLDGTGINESFIIGTTVTAGVAVDGAHVYWTNFLAGSIGRANLDGTGINQSFTARAPTKASSPAPAPPAGWRSMR